MARKHSITSLITDDTKRKADKLRRKGDQIQESTSSLYSRIIDAGVEALTKKQKHD